MMFAGIAVGIILCLIVQKLWARLNKWLNNFQGFAFFQEKKAEEFEQYLNTSGT